MKNITLNGNRKLMFVAILIVIGFAIDFFTERGLSLNLLELLKWLGGTYVLGNVGEHFAEGTKKKADAKSAMTGQEAQLLLSTLDQSLTKLNVGQEAILHNIQISNQGLSQILQKRG